MPGTPTQATRPVNTAVGPLDNHTFSTEVTSGWYGVSYADFPDIALDAEGVLDGARDGAVRNVNGVLRSEQRIALGAHPGRDLVVEVPGRAVVRQRIYLAGHRLYQLVVVTDQPPNSPEIERFLNSFTLLGP
jgi:hypothetical protein